MLLFLILLFCAVAQKISLVILTSNRYDDTAAVNRTNDVSQLIVFA